MNPAFLYFFITIGFPVLISPIAYYDSHKRDGSLSTLLLLINLLLPMLTAIFFIYVHQPPLTPLFINKLTLFSVPYHLILFSFLYMPCIIIIATLISLACGGSKKQFLLNKELTVMKGWKLIGILIPFLLAPLIEELGWRGYGVDSLLSSMQFYPASLTFGILWGLWHLPLFFFKGYYQNTLLKKGSLFVINFFLSVILISVLMNWVYVASNKSIPLMVLFHAMLNVSSMLFRTEDTTKCISTLLLLLTTCTLPIWWPNA